MRLLGRLFQVHFDASSYREFFMQLFSTVRVSQFTKLNGCLWGFEGEYDIHVIA